MDLQLAWPTEHLFGGTVFVRFGEGLASRPSLEVFHGAPPGFDLVAALRIGVVDELATLVVKPDRSRAVHFVANEARRLVDQVGAIAETVFEIDLVPLGDAHTIGDDYHRLVVSAHSSRIIDIVAKNAYSTYP